MADDIRAEALASIDAFRNNTIPRLQEHINKGGHTVEHLQEIVNALKMMNEEMLNPEQWAVNPVVGQVEAVQHPSEESGGPASTGASRT